MQSQHRFVTWQWPSGGVVLHRPLRRTPSPGPRSLWMQHIELTTGWQWPWECSKFKKCCCKRHHPPGSTKDGNCTGLSLHPVAPSSAKTQRIKNDKEWQRITKNDKNATATTAHHAPASTRIFSLVVKVYPLTWLGDARCTWNKNKQNSVLKQWNAKADVPEINPV